MNRELWQKPPPPQQQVGLDQIINLHSYLSTIKEPSERVKTAIERLETIICNFAFGLQQGPKP